MLVYMFHVQSQRIMLSQLPVYAEGKILLVHSAVVHIDRITTAHIFIRKMILLGLPCGNKPVPIVFTAFGGEFIFFRPPRTVSALQTCFIFFSFAGNHVNYAAHCFRAVKRRPGTFDNLNALYIIQTGKIVQVKRSAFTHAAGKLTQIKPPSVNHHQHPVIAVNANILLASGKALLHNENSIHIFQGRRYIAVVFFLNFCARHHRHIRPGFRYFQRRPGRRHHHVIHGKNRFLRPSYAACG